MGGAVSACHDNEELIDKLIEADYVRTDYVERALRLVDRGDYFLEQFRSEAYRDTAWKSGNLHLSAPCIYAEALENLDLRRGHSFLNVGSGTGYLNTVVGTLLGPSGINHGVELHEEVVEYATKRLQEFVYKSTAIDMTEFCLPKFVTGNSLQLDLSTAFCYDRIYCGAAVPCEHEAYVKSLVKIGGIIVLPCGDQLQQIVRTSADQWEIKSVLPVSFASLIVPVADVNGRIALNVRLPERTPARLQELCRQVIRTRICVLLLFKNPDLQLRSYLSVHSQRRHKQQHQDGTADDPDDNDASSASETLSPSDQRRQNRRVRRIVIPVLNDDSDDDSDNETNGSRGSRIRHRIIAIGSADISHDRGGRVTMNDVQWNQFFVGSGEQDEEDSDEETDEHRSVDANVSADSAVNDSNKAVENIEDSSSVGTFDLRMDSLEAEPGTVGANEAQRDSNIDLTNMETDDADATCSAIPPPVRKMSFVEIDDSCDDIDEDRLSPLPQIAWINEPSPSSEVVDQCKTTTTAADVDSKESESTVLGARRRRKRERVSLTAQNMKKFSQLFLEQLLQLPLPANLKDYLNYYR